ncbi:hypothetical protein GN956_G2560 [Arapaima gigas]
MSHSQQPEQLEPGVRASSDKGTSGTGFSALSSGHVGLAPSSTLVTGDGPPRGFTLPSSIPSPHGSFLGKYRCDLPHGRLSLSGVDSGSTPDQHQRQTALGPLGG